MNTLYDTIQLKLKEVENTDIKKFKKIQILYNELKPKPGELCDSICMHRNMTSILNLLGVPWDNKEWFFQYIAIHNFFVKGEGEWI